MDAVIARHSPVHSLKYGHVGIVNKPKNGQSKKLKTIVKLWLRPLFVDFHRSMMVEENNDIANRLMQALQYALLVWLEEQNRILEQRRLHEEWVAEEDEMEWVEPFDWPWIESTR